MGKLSLEDDNARKSNANGPSVSEGDHDSGVDESTQGGSRIPKQTPPQQQPQQPPMSPAKSATGARPRIPRSKSATKANRLRSQSVPKPAFSPFGSTPTERAKKVPMNKIRVGMSDSPNIRSVGSKVGSLDNASHRASGGNVKIEDRRLEWKTVGRTDARNPNYTPQGGNIKVESRRLAWNATSKVGSLNNAKHKAGGGEKKIFDQRMKVEGKSKVGSTDNMKHKAGGGNVKILHEKVEVKVESKVGSLANVKHKAGGGDKKVFNDVEYLRQTSAMHASSGASGSSSRRQSASQPHSLDNSTLPPTATQGKPKEPSPYAAMMRRKLSPMSTGY